jgi:hypothetical protein
MALGNPATKLAKRLLSPDLISPVIATTGVLPTHGLSTEMSAAFAMANSADSNASIAIRVRMASLEPRRFTAPANEPTTLKFYSKAIRPDGAASSLDPIGE